MTAKWFQIVKNYPNNFGPTIPFILGAMRQPIGQVLPPNESLEQLRDLLVALRDDAHYPYKVVIQECGGIGEPIVTLFDNVPPNYLRFNSSSKHGRALYVQPLYGLEINEDDFESLVKSIWDRYETVISEGHFSRREGKWDVFDVKELANLKEYCDIE